MPPITFKLLQVQTTVAVIVAGLLGLHWMTKQSSAQSVLTIVSAANFERAVTPDSIAVVFGSQLAPRTEIAPGLPLPTTLAGTSVEVNGVLAGLFFVSPGQINFLVPTVTPAGTVNIVVRTSGSPTQTGVAQVSNVAPAVFTANSTGQGVAAATVLRVKTDSAQSFEPVAQFDALQNRFITRPINFGTGGDRVFLILYLCGVRRATNVRLAVGGTEIPTTFAGGAPGYVGLDQINAELPSALTGRGIINVVVRANGVADSKPVEIEMAAAFVSGRAPRAFDDSIPMDEDTIKTVTLRGDDVNNRPLRYIVTHLPQHGRLSGSLPNPTYTPQADYNGPDDFAFKVSNGIEDSNEATVTMNIRQINDPPSLNVPGSQLINVSQQLSFDLVATDADSDQTLTITAEPMPTGATLTFLDARRRRFTWTPITDQGGKIFTFTFSVQDDGSPRLSNVKTVLITVGLLWGKTSGPEGARITTLIASGSSFYAGTFTGGVYRSTDNGRSWTPINGDLAVRSIYSLYARGTRLFAGTVDGTFYTDNNGQNWRAAFRGVTTYSLVEIGAILYAGTKDSGIRASGDGGQTWSIAPDSAPGFCLIANALVARGNTLFAGVTDVLPCDSGLYISTDNAQSWRQLRNGLPNNGYLEVVKLVANQTHLFAAISTFGASGIYVSADNGQNWTAANNGLTNRNVLALAVSGSTLVASTTGGLFISNNNAQSWSPINSSFTNQPVNALLQDGNSLMAGTNGSAVFLSTDNGQNWTSVGGGFTNSLATAFALDAVGSSLYAATDVGVYVSNNNGQSWAVFNSSLPNSSRIRALAVSGANLLASAGSGVFVSANQGRAWTPVNTGLTNQSVSALATLGGRVFAATAGGVFVSADNGQRWSPASNGLTNQTVTSLAVSGARLYAGTLGGVHVSTDNGQSWNSLGLQNEPIHGVAVNGDFIVAISRTGNFVSADQGRNWRSVTEGLGNPVVTIAIRGTTAYAGLEQDGVYALSPESDRWMPVNESLTDFTVNAMIVNGGNLFIGTTDGVSLSTNSPQTWAALNANLASLGVDSVISSGGIVFAGTAGGGIFRLQDQATNWTASDTNLPAGVRISSLVARNQTLFGGTRGSGVFRSSDQGRNWTAVNNGLTNQTVNALAANSTQVFAGTDGGGGVYSIPEQGIVWEAVSTNLANRRIFALTAGEMNLFAGSEFGQIFRSDNQGLSWTSLRRLESAIRDARFLDIRSLSLIGSDLFAGTAGASLYRSSDGGQNWALLAQSDLGDRLYVTSFATSGSRLYIGTYSGIFFSTDQGRTWRQINAGLTSTYVNSITVNGDKLYAGTANGGVFVSKIPE